MAAKSPFVDHNASVSPGELTLFTETSKGAEMKEKMSQTPTLNQRVASAKPFITLTIY